MDMVRNLLAVRAIRGVAVVLMLVGLGFAGYLVSTKSVAHPPSSAGPLRDPNKIETAKRHGNDGLWLEADAVNHLRLRTGTVATASHPIPLPPFHGVLALDNDRLSRVHSRFPGEVTEIGQPADGKPTFRVGDPVHKGDLLAVIWSKDLGEKKCELIDALTRLRSEEKTLDRLRKLYESGAGAERSVRDAERTVQGARVDVAKAERTLRTWRLTDSDIQAVRDEAERIAKLERGPVPTSNDWPRVEVRAAFDGVVLEKNIALGDIVDTTATLFTIGDMKHLTVWAHIYEEDLSLLQKIPKPIPWSVHVPSNHDHSFPGNMEKIGAMIDPVQHTALVSGRVENPRGELRVGQAVKVHVNLPAPKHELEVPSAAVVEDGRQSIVFVQPDPSVPHFARRSVKVVRRFRDIIYIRDEGVKAGDTIVTDGALLLRDAMDQLPLASAD
jgi:cobalt-zinc-cadmium efflux system membrane fusion protein